MSVRFLIPALVCCLGLACSNDTNHTKTASTAASFVKAAGLPVEDTEAEVSGRNVKFGGRYTLVVSDEGDYVVRFINEERTREVQGRSQLPNSLLIRDAQAARSRLGEMAYKLQMPEGADIVSFENGDMGEITADFRVYPERFKFIQADLANGMKITIDGKDGVLVRFQQNRDTVVENSRVQISKEDAVKKAGPSADPDRIELLYVPRPGSKKRVRLAYVIPTTSGSVWIDAADGTLLSR